jgi:hypothetical protein
LVLGIGADNSFVHGSYRRSIRDRAGLRCEG